MMQDEIFSQVHEITDEFPYMITCALCGEVWHIDDMDEEYPDCCKSCVEATSDLEGEL